MTDKENMLDRQGVALSEEVWGVRIGDSDRWAYTNSESDADFWGKQSGLKYEKRRYVRASEVTKCAECGGAGYHFHGFGEDSECNACTDRQPDEVAPADQQSVAPSDKGMREAFEEALPFIGGTIHVFSPTRTARDERYLEGVTEVCWRTWQAAFSRASSSRAEVESHPDTVRLNWLMKNVNCDEIEGIELPFGGTLEQHFDRFRAAIDAQLAAAEAPNGEKRDA